MLQSLVNRSGAVLLLHLVGLLWHGSNHMQIPVHLHPWQWGFVGIVITLLPVLGWLGILLGWNRTGALLFGGAMLGAFLFGVFFHLILPNPDHVHAVPSTWTGHSFQVSALFLAAVEALGTWVGFAPLIRGASGWSTTEARS